MLLILEACNLPYVRVQTNIQYCLQPAEPLKFPRTFCLQHHESATQLALARMKAQKVMRASLRITFTRLTLARCYACFNV